MWDELGGLAAPCTIQRPVRLWGRSLGALGMSRLLRVSLSGRGRGHSTVIYGCWGPGAMKPPGDSGGATNSNEGQPCNPPAAKPDPKARRAALAGSRRPSDTPVLGERVVLQDPLGGDNGTLAPGLPRLLPTRLSLGCWGSAPCSDVASKREGSSSAELCESFQPTADPGGWSRGHPPSTHVQSGDKGA